MDMHFDGVIFQTYAAELARRLRYPWPPCAVLDVRALDEFHTGHIEGAVHAPVQRLRDEGLPAGVDAGTEVIVVGRALEDPEARSASLLLRRAGARRIVELTGGMAAWREARLPVRAGESAA